jgi:penicillin amidase
MRWSSFSRILRPFLAMVLLVAGTAFVAGWWICHRALPTLEGTASLPGLQQQVTVDRDRWGIPRIQAGSLEDLAMAQGYVTAQDRLWQMDLLRRVAGGELSEIFGPVGLELDRENRTLGLRGAAERAAQEMDAETRRVVEAYARGVNRYIAERRGRLPIEFVMLRYSPRAWTPADTFLISAYMWKVLTTTWQSKLNRAWVTQRLGPDKARDLFVIDSPLDHYVVGQPAPLTAPPAGSPVQPGASAVSSEAPVSSAAWSEARGILAQFQADISGALGSNNFVVNGAHTYSGKPLLANDTHLGLGVPCIWYIVHLEAPGWNVKGFALPGAPLVIIGHNDRIAWGFTNSNADVQDLYAETMNPANPLEYRVNGAWVAATVRREVIRIKGRADESLDVVTTRHGPIVSREGGRAYALRWTATEPGGLGFAFPLLGRAQNWDEFRDVARRIPGPGQNAVYADVDGNIGYFLGARIPIRKTGDGALPVPGDTDDFEWTGFIPSDDLPQAFNPPEGVIATANARSVGPSYPWFLSERWSAPYRTERMYQLLASRKDLRPADANAVQNDTVSLPDRFLAGQLLAAAKIHPPADARAREVLARLTENEWNGRASTASVETSFLEFTRHALMHNLLAPYLGDKIEKYELWEPQSIYSNVWWRDKVFLENVLRERPAAWLPKSFPDYDALLSASADQAAADLAQATHTNDTASWSWGVLHMLEMLHPLGRSGPLHAFLSVGPVAVSGTLDTVKAMGHGHGPAMRFVADLANWDNSFMEIATGESGQYGSPDYLDQFPEWFEGRGIPSTFSSAAEGHARIHELVLQPAADSPADK